MKHQRIAPLLGIVVIGLGLLTSPGWAQTWSEPVQVRGPDGECVSYRVRLDKDWLIVEASHAPGWHTYAMDNQQRADRQLAGRESLGIEQETLIDLGEGLEAAGGWYQTEPRDLSKPALRWYTWGFDGRAHFAVQVKRTGRRETVISIRGQACNAESCQSISVSVKMPLTGAPPAGASLDEPDRARWVRVEAASPPTRE